MIANWKENEIHNVCPVCLVENDCASDPIGDAVPKPGDVTICISCGSVGVFTENMSLRMPTKAELRWFSKDPELGRLQEAVLRAKAMREGFR